MGGLTVEVRPFDGEGLDDLPEITTPVPAPPATPPTFDDLPRRRPRRPPGANRKTLLESVLEASDPLSALILTVGQTSKACDPQTAIVRCGCRWRKVEEGCGSSDCPACAERVGNRRAKRAIFRLTAGLPDHRWPVCYTVLTVPPRYRAACVDPKVWGQLRSAAWKELKKRFGGVFGLEATHPVGDPGEQLHLRMGECSDPTVFHPHLNFLWVRCNQQGTINVAELRVVWADLLARVLGKRGRGRPPKVVVHHGFVLGNDQRLLHRVKYVTRTFPGWGFWLGNMRWFGRYPKTKAPPCLCEHCGERWRPVAGGIWGEIVAERWTAAGVPEDTPLRRGQAPPWGTA